MRRLALAVLLLAGAPALAQTRVIVVDPGHGGTDPGGTGNGQREKDIVLDVSRRFVDLLAKDTADAGGGGSWKALLTRNDDTFVSLSARAAYANSQGADRFMSIHSNAFGDPSANGTETFSLAEGTTGAALRNLVQDEMIKAWGLRNRGNKTANFAVLRETSMPAELHELAFITNTTDVQKLASATERQKAAEAHLRALQRHYGIAPYLPKAGGTPPPPPPPPPPMSGGTGGTGGGAEPTPAMPSDVTLSLVVLDGATRAPITGATLSAAGRVAKSAADGRALLTLPPGVFDVLVEAPGYAPTSIDVDLKADVAVDVLLTPEGGVGSGCAVSGPAGSASPLALLLLALPLFFRRRRA